MTIFKSLPALVALAVAGLSLVLTLVSACWPLLLAYVPAAVYPLVLFAVCAILVVLHYEKLLEDAAGGLAGTTPWSTVAADLKAALSEGFTQTIAAMSATAKTTLPETGPAVAPSVTATVAAVVGDLATGIPQVTQAAETAVQSIAAGA